jgi:hypothetical protein
MKPVPSKAAEAIVAFLIPPACRESVLGDLYERYASPRQYLMDVVCTVPLVIMSRIRRTMDLRMVLMEASVLYLAFLAAARYMDMDAGFPADPRGMFRLAIPPAAALVALILGDAYADPRKPSALQPIRGTALAVGFAFFSQALLSVGNRELSLPLWIMLSGGGVGLLLVSALRMLFPVADEPRPANGPALWQEPAAEPLKPGLVTRGVVACMGLLILGTILLIAYKRS